MKEKLQLYLREEHYIAMLERYHFRQTDLDQLRWLGEILLRTAEPVMYYAPCRVIDIDEHTSAEISDTEEQAGAGISETDVRGADAKARGKKAESTKHKRTQLEANSANRVEEGTQLAAIVSLGDKVDALQNEYIDKERLTEAYMMECIGMELLKTAYELTAQKVWEKYGLWMSGFVFLGEKYPLELTEDVFRLLVPENITYNQAYMLTPKKTVVFMTTLHKERKAGYCRVCDTCSNLQCPNRQSEGKIKEQEKEEISAGWSSGIEQNRVTNLNYGYQKIFGKP